MDIKKRLISLAVMPALSLFAAEALADVSNPLNSMYATSLEVGEELKKRADCGGATFIKNAFPSLTNGTPGGDTTIDFSVDGKTVSMIVTWYDTNSFDFRIIGGWAPKIGVTVDTNDFLFGYANPSVGITDPAMGFQDMQLNYYGLDPSTGLPVTGDDVNHLDLCLETLDTAVPDVSIRVEPSSDGTTVSGITSIIATVTDESGLNSVNIEIVSADGTLTFIVCDATDPECELTGPTVSGKEYTWTLNASLLPIGDYVIRVKATDASILANVVEEEKNITVVRSLEDCLEGPDFVPPGQPSGGGCNLTGFMQLEYPNAAGAIENLTVTQAAIQAISAPSPSCRTDLFPLIAQDPRVDEFGNVIASSMTQDLSELFDIAGHYAQFHPGELVPQVFLRADTVGSPCLTLLHQDAPEFSELTAALPNGGVYTVTQFPEEVPGIYDGLDRITAPLNYCDPTLANCGLLPDCYDNPDPAVECYQPDLQFVEQAALQTDDLLLLIERAASPFTSDVFNASRTKGFKGTFFPLNTREVCLFVDPALEPSDGAPYYEAVLQCKIDLAVEYFDNLEDAVIEADPNLISPSLNSLLTDVNKARSMVKVRRWDKATTDLSSLLDQVLTGTWNVDFRNDPGNVIMRIENLFFRIEQLEKAENNLP